jgi:hypothetical protein
MAKLKTYTQAQLSEILRNHQHWLDKDVDGWVGMQANLPEANLSGANLSGANLSGANLSEANLSEADLSRAKLFGAKLIGAKLFGAKLIGAKLSEADLSRASLSGADLSRANLSEADLSRASLSGAKLIGANLSRADLSRASLSRADLSRAKNIPYVPMACPDNGSFTGWKKARGYIVKLLIPEDAKRSSSSGRKCRCDKAIVLEIQNPDGTKADVDVVTSNRDEEFLYRVGETVSVPDFCDNRFLECAAGIHFFINRQEAVEYNG